VRLGSACIVQRSAQCRAAMRFHVDHGRGSARGARKKRSLKASAARIEERCGPAAT
jgi:hypothetical protein